MDGSGDRWEDGPVAGGFLCFGLPHRPLRLIPPGGKGGEGRGDDDVVESVGERARLKVPGQGPTSNTSSA